jgi:hypothetical protein
MVKLDHKTTFDVTGLHARSAPLDDLVSYQNNRFRAARKAGAGGALARLLQWSSFGVIVLTFAGKAAHGFGIAAASLFIAISLVRWGYWIMDNTIEM